MVIKCRMCGGDILFQPGDTYGKCDSCNSINTIPNSDDEGILNLYNRANHFRRQGEFDKALSVYERILEEDNTDPEAHWGAVLSRYGIEYVEDPATKKHIPTCQRLQVISILSDADYLAACEYARDAESHKLYEAQAKEIAEIQKGILAISQNEEPYDVFICYKEKDEQRRRTPDSVLAQQVYYSLTEAGYRVFFSRITLEDKLGQEYEPYIFAALHSARVMLVIGTKPTYFDAVWVKNEWSRYLTLMKTDRKRLLIPCYRDMDPYSLPDALSYLQSQDMSQISFMQDLLHGVKKVLGTKKQPTAEQSSTQTASRNIAALVDRAFLALEDGELKNANDFCEQALNLDARNPRCYLIKLMIDLKVHRHEDLRYEISPLIENKNYKKALRFADDELKKELEGYNQAIMDRIVAIQREEEERKQQEEEKKARKVAEEERKRCEAEEARIAAAKRAEEERKRIEAEKARLARQKAEEEEKARIAAETEARIQEIKESFRRQEVQYNIQYESLQKLKTQQSQQTKNVQDEDARLLALRQESSELKGFFNGAKRRELEQQIENSIKTKQQLKAQLQKTKDSVIEAERHLASAPDHQALKYQIGTMYLQSRMYDQAYDCFVKIRQYQGVEMLIKHNVHLLVREVKASHQCDDCFSNDIKQDYSDVMKWYCKNADENNAESQYMIGFCFEQGLGVSQNYHEAAKWFSKAAEQGDTFAQNSLGILLKNGHGLPQNYDEAAKWFYKAAEQGYAKAQANLGNCYLEGCGVPQSYEEAVKWYRMAAVNGDGTSQVFLGWYYSGRFDGTRDYKEAAKWFRKASEQAEDVAQNELGILYTKGLGVPKDYKEAAKWFRKAAEQGEVRAQYNLGLIYENGYGLTRNYSEAVKWYIKAADQGYDNAIKALKRLMDKLK